MPSFPGNDYNVGQQNVDNVPDCKNFLLFLFVCLFMDIFEELRTAHSNYVL